MDCVGVIVEYNPLHHGHYYHLQETKKQVPEAAILAVMSGSWVQRGEPAVANKWHRTKAALSAGVDLVVELPAAFAVQSAQGFARGAVALLAATGIVNYISFGSELGEIEPLMELASLLSKPRPPWQEKLHFYLSEGVSYPAAMGKAVSTWNKTLGDILTSPNNVLALEYLQALQRLSAPIRPVTIRRMGAGYNQGYLEQDQLPSATAIRKELARGNNDTAFKMMPDLAAAEMEQAFAEGAGPIWNNALIPLYLGRLRSLTPREISHFPEVSEGLESRLSRAGRDAATLEELISLLKTRRYTRTRLQRILFYLITGITKEGLRAFNRSGPAYIRVLGFSDRGRKELLPLIKGRGTLPLVSRPAPFLRSHPSTSIAGAMLTFDILANDLQALGAYSPFWRRGGSDYRLPPIHFQESG